MYKIETIKKIVQAKSKISQQKEGVYIIPCTKSSMEDSSLTMFLGQYVPDGHINSVKAQLKRSKFEAKCCSSASCCVADESHDLQLIFISVELEKDADASCIGQYVELGGLVADKIIGKNKNIFILSGLISDHAEQNTVQKGILTGLMQKSYSFDKYMTTKVNKKNKESKVSSVEIEIEQSEAAEAISVIEGIFAVKNLINEPANIVNPEDYADYVHKHFNGSKVKVKVIDNEELKEMGMNLLVGVGQASSYSSKVVIMEYMGNDSTDEIELNLLGKGVTFDTGGLSLKPAQYMYDMKVDMGGSSVVVGAMHALSQQNVKKNIVGIIGLVENSVNEHAQRPGDVITSYSGKTVEVINTDAEGRLVLADLIAYSCEKYKPAVIIDLATLTGAVMVTLGTLMAGLFSRSDELSEKLLKASKSSGEGLFRLPMGKKFADAMKSPFADIGNISRTMPRDCGASTAAEFLQYFVEGCKHYAHLDIAGVAYDGKYSNTSTKGASGYGVMLLCDYVKKYM